MNDLNRLPPGTYRLSATVKNPTPDRRFRNAWVHASEWAEGTLFTVEQFQGDSDPVIRQPNLPGQLYSSDQSYRAISQRLVQIRESAFQFITRVSANPAGTAANILAVLVERGLVSDATVKSLTEEMEHVDSNGVPTKT